MRTGDTAYVPVNQELTQGSLLINVKTLSPIVTYIQVIAEVTLALVDQSTVITPVADLIETVLLDKTAPPTVVKLPKEIVV